MEIVFFHQIAKDNARFSSQSTLIWDELHNKQINPFSVFISFQSKIKIFLDEFAFFCVCVWNLTAQFPQIENT